MRGSTRKDPHNYKSCVDRRNSKYDGKRCSSTWASQYSGRTSYHHTFVQIGRLRDKIIERIKWNIEMQKIRFT